jgi:hypothetical protein
LCIHSNNLLLYISGSEQKYATFSSIDKFQEKRYHRDVHNNKYHMQTLPDYDEKHFRTFSELESGFGVKNADSVAPTENDLNWQRSVAWIID